jgi:flagellar basal-body rod protein FlgB
MFISSVTDRGAAPALVNTLAFNEARLKVIAENVANATTPGYRAKQLDPQAFQAALRDALDARGGDPRKPFVIKDNGQVRTTRQGWLEVTPGEHPVDGVLFHDGTNLSIEREMADLAETGMTHELAAALLYGKFAGLRKAIRGTSA